MGLCCSVEPPVEFKLQEDEQQARIRLKRQAAVAKSPLLKLSIIFDTPESIQIGAYLTEMHSKETIKVLLYRCSQRLNIGIEHIELRRTGVLVGPETSDLEDTAITDGAELHLHLLGDINWHDVLAATEAVRSEAATLDIHWAANRGDLEVIEKVAMHAPDRINELDANLETPLRWAAGFGRAMAVNRLIEAKGDVNAKNKWGNTPVYYAIQNQHTAVVAMLKEAGAIEQSEPAQSSVEPVAAEGEDDVPLPGAVNTPRN